jgi:tetratricopeptide (TPR) repeat protein
VAEATSGSRDPFEDDPFEGGAAPVASGSGDPFEDDPFEGGAAPVTSESDDPFEDDPFEEEARGGAPDDAPDDASDTVPGAEGVAAEATDPFASDAEVPVHTPASPEEGRGAEGETGKTPPPATERQLPAVEPAWDEATAKVQLELPGAAVKLPAPARILSSSDGATGDTSIAQVAPAQRQPLGVVVAVCVGLVAAVGGGGLWFLDEHHRAAEKASFLRRVDPAEPDAGLAAYELLSPRVQEDADIQARVAELRERVARVRAREEARAILDEVGPRADRSELASACDRALAADGSFAEAYLARARLRAAQGREAGGSIEEAFAGALEDLDAALESAPDLAEAWLERGRLRRVLGDGDGARADLERAAGLEPGSPPGLLAAARLSLLEGDAEAAMGRARRAEAKAPGLDPLGRLARLTLAEAALALGRGDEARARIEQVLAEAPDHAQAKVLLVEVRGVGAGEASRLLAEAVASDPFHARGHAFLAALRLRAGDVEGARASAEAALALDADQAPARCVLALLALDEERFDDAWGQVDAAVLRGGQRDQARALVLRARVALRSGRPGADPLEDLDRALSLDPTRTDALLLRAEERERAGRTDDALADLDLALRASEALPRAHLLRARLLLTRRPPPLGRILEDLGRALQFSPDLAEARYVRARAYLEGARYRDALADLERAEGGAPAHALRRLAGDCHYGLGDWAAAGASYKVYLEAAGAEADARVRARAAECERREGSARSDF